MNRKIYIPLTIGVLLSTTWWLAIRKPISTEKTTKRVVELVGGATHQVNRETSEKRLTALEAAAQLSGDQQVHRQGEFDKLRQDLLISGESLKDQNLCMRQQEAIRKLGSLRSPEAVSLIMEALLDPEQKYFIKQKSASAALYTNSYCFMEMLEFCVDGVPEPNNNIYDDRDLPRFKTWWYANKSKLRFKTEQASASGSQK